MKTDQDIGARRRDPLFDILKAFLMLWVVWGHCHVSGVVAGPLWPDPWMKNAKIAVDMPLFFVISGFMAAHSKYQDVWKKTFQRLVRLIWPVAAFGLCFGTCLAFMDGHDFSFPLRFATKQVLYGHWFIRSLASLYVILALVVSLCKTIRMQAFGLLIAWILLLAGNDNSPENYHPMIYCGWQIVHMLPYFAFGFLVLPKWRLHTSILVSIACGIAFFTFVLVEGNSSRNGMNYWAVTTNWKEICSCRGGFLFAVRTTIGCTGSVFLLWAMNAILRIAPSASRLQVFGTTTLGVYILHELPLYRIGQSGWKLLPLLQWTGLIVAITYFLIIHFTIVGIRNVPFLRRFFFGMS